MMAKIALVLKRKRKESNMRELDVIWEETGKQYVNIKVAVLEKLEDENETLRKEVAYLKKLIDGVGLKIDEDDECLIWKANWKYDY